MEKYNGWTNYQTWRIYLEVFQGYEQEVQSTNPNKFDLAESLEQQVEDMINDESDIDSLSNNYAKAFISDVNWLEIAEHLLVP